jgi:hypothetical protein
MKLRCGAVLSGAGSSVAVPGRGLPGRRMMGRPS